MDFLASLSCLFTVLIHFPAIFYVVEEGTCSYCKILCAKIGMIFTILICYNKLKGKILYLVHLNCLFSINAYQLRIHSHLPLFKSGEYIRILLFCIYVKG